MGLRIYVKGDGPVVPTTVGRDDVFFHKTIKPPRRFGRTAIYVTPCKNHLPPTPTVPVDCYKSDPITRLPTRLGRVKACPICWTVLSVVDGDELLFRFEECNLGKDEMQIFLQVHGKSARKPKKTSP